MDVTIPETIMNDRLTDALKNVRGRRPLIMGILNVTPDSFFDGGLYNSTDAAVSHALALMDEGADIVDVGGESTRPPGRDYGSGSTTVPVQEELDRVIPVIEGIMKARPHAIVSVDTMKVPVARLALENGSAIINDVSAGQYDSEMFAVAADNDAWLVLMHGHDAAVRKPVDSAEYDDVVAEVGRFLDDRTKQAHGCGVHKVIADPGIGFAKAADDSMRLIRELKTLVRSGIPMLVGASRKSFIGRALGGSPPTERLYGTLAAHAAAFVNGASIVRVHDVKPAAEFFALFGSLVGLSGDDLQVLSRS